MRPAPLRPAAVCLAMLALAAAPMAAGQSKSGLKLPPVDPNAPLDAPTPTSRPRAMTLLEMMRELAPLEKTHYSYPLGNDLLASPSHPLTLELARITGAVCVSGEFVTRDQMAVAVAIATAAGANRKRPVTIGVNFSPWHRRFAKDLPATDTGPSADAEVRFMRERMDVVRAWLAEANTRQQASVRVTAVLLNTERFHVSDAVNPQPGGVDAAIREKCDIAFRIFKEAFPEAKIIWYAFGGVHPASGGDGFSVSNFFPLDALHENFSLPFYRGHEIDTQRECMRRTVKLAKSRGVEEVIPWVALASGYRRTMRGPEWEWDSDWRYEIIYAWLLGREINRPWFGRQPERYAPYGAATCVVFYPPPFDPRTPEWGRYFVAYVRGAHDLPELPE